MMTQLRFEDPIAFWKGMAIGIGVGFVLTMVVSTAMVMLMAL